MSAKKILIYGYGNPGRQDDGLGIKCAEEIEKWQKEENLEGVCIDQNYQLNIEDAHRIAEFDIVIFVDASVTDVKSFKLETIVPNLSTDFSMHSVSPSFVVGLCADIFNRIPKSYQLHIKGSEFEFMEEISSRAEINLKSATEYLKEFILNAG